MTDQEKQEIIAEVKASVMDEVKKEIGANESKN